MEQEKGTVIGTTLKPGSIAKIAFIALAVWLGLQLLWHANILIFVIFLGVLFGVATAKGVDKLEARGIRRGIGSALIIFSSVGLLAMSFVLLAPTLYTQAQELKRDLPEALERIQSLVNKSEFGFLDPFLGPSSDSVNDTAVVEDSLIKIATEQTAEPAPVRTPPKLPAIDTATLAAIQSVSQALDEDLKSRTPGPRDLDSGLLSSIRRLNPLASRNEPPEDSLAQENTASANQDSILEARTNFLRDSLRRAMRSNREAEEQRYRDEIMISTGDPASPRATRSELLARRLSSGLAGSSFHFFSLLTGTIAVLGGLVMIMFLAIYIGAEPQVYKRWVLAVVPAIHRARVRSIMTEMGTVLRKWLVTQLVAMIVIGVVSTTILLLLDVRAAFALGFLAGLLEFIPTIGPILAAIPAIAMGLIDSPQKALMVLLAYWAIQFLENNLLIPALMRGGMDLPPAMTLIAQALMAILFGFLGLMIAVPLTAAVLVPIRLMAADQDVQENLLSNNKEETVS